MIDKTSQLSAIQEKDQQKKLLESKLAQLFYVTCEQELNDESSLGIVSSYQNYWKTSVPLHCLF